MSEDAENLCEYVHPLMRCKGRSNIDNQRKCKYFPKTGYKCNFFDIQGCGDCGNTSAYFEYWMLNEKPE